MQPLKKMSHCASQCPSIMRPANKVVLCRLLREETAEATALREKEAAEEAERQRVRASIRGALKKPVSTKIPYQALPSLQSCDESCLWLNHPWHTPHMAIKLRY